MKQFCKKIGLLLVMVAAGTSIAQAPSLPELLPEIQRKIANQQIQEVLDYMRQFPELAHTFRGHTDAIYSVAFSPDGSKIVFGYLDNTVKIWDVQTWQLLQTLQDPAILENTAHDGFVFSVAFSPDGSNIVSGSGDKTIKIWAVDDGQLIRTLQDPAIQGNTAHDGSVYSVAFSPDGSKLVSGSSDKTIKMWDVQTWQLLQTIQDPATQENTAHDGSVFSVKFSSDGSKFVSASRDETVKIWDVQTGQLDKTLLDRTIFVLISRPLRKTLLGHRFFVRDAEFSPDDSKIVSASNDKTISIWDVQTGQLIQTLRGHTNIVRSVQFSPDGSKIISASDDKTVNIWDVQTWKLLQTLQDPATQGNTAHDGFVFSVAFSPDGSNIISGSEDKIIKMWDMKVERKQLVFTWFEHNLHPDQAVIINRAYEAKLRGKKLVLKGDGLVTFNTMPEDVRSLLIEYLDIIEQPDINEQK